MSLTENMTSASGCPTLSTAALRSAAVTAVLVGVLALPLAGVQLIDAGGRPGLELRPLWVLVPMAAAFVLRFVLIRARVFERPRLTLALPRNPLAGRIPPRALLALAAVLAILFPLSPLGGRYEIDLASTFLTYVMLGWGLNIVVGMAGLLDLGYVAFYAAGAYTFAILNRDFGLGFWQALPLCVMVATLLGVVLGFPVLRLRGDYLAIVTLGFGEIIRLFLVNAAPVTGGPNGITGIARPTFFGYEVAARAPEGTGTLADLTGLAFSPMHRVIWLYYIALLFAAVVGIVIWRLRNMAIGRSWEALREDELAVAAMGINPTTAKLQAFAIGAGVGGLAGCFFAGRQGFISPESFVFMESAVLLAIVVLGGLGSHLGVVLAAAFLVFMPEIARSFAEYRMLFFGLAMVGVMVLRPGGLISHRRPSILAPRGWRAGAGPAAEAATAAAKAAGPAATEGESR